MLAISSKSLHKWLESSSKDRDQTEEGAIKAARKQLIDSKKGKKRKSS